MENFEKFPWQGEQKPSTTATGTALENNTITCPHCGKDHYFGVTAISGPYQFVCGSTSGCGNLIGVPTQSQVPADSVSRCTVCGKEKSDAEVKMPGLHQCDINSLILNSIKNGSGPSNTDRQLRDEAQNAFPVLYNELNSNRDRIDALLRQEGYVLARKQSLSELSEAKKQIEELKEQVSFFEEQMVLRHNAWRECMHEIAQLKADKKQVEWIASSDMDNLIDGEVYCVYYQKGDTKARVTAEYKNGKWLMHWARAVVDITDSVTHYQEFPAPPASLSPQTPEP